MVKGLLKGVENVDGDVLLRRVKNVVRGHLRRFNDDALNVLSIGHLLKWLVPFKLTIVESVAIPIIGR
jgi:hypothetical protein